VPIKGEIEGFLERRELEPAESLPQLNLCPSYPSYSFHTAFMAVSEEAETEFKFSHLGIDWEKLVTKSYPH
jgi:hypothetical protein